jgi:hypothetical protein
MRKPSGKPKLGQVGDYWLTKNPDRSGPNDAWCRTWYDRSSQQTRRASLGTADFHEASVLLANWVVENGKSNADIRQDKVLIEAVLINYWNEHAKNLPSASAAWNGLCYWSEFWKDRTVADILPHEQKRFRKWLAAKPDMNEGGIDRVLSDGRAALNRAEKWKELDVAPHIFGILTAEEKRSREPMGRPIVPSEMARLFDAAKSRHILVYLIIATNTLARPAAVLDARGAQFDELHNRIDLNPPGRKQNKKYRPILAVTQTLLPWLKTITEPQHRYVTFGGRAIKSIKTVWESLRVEANLDERVTPYSIRHGMAREMRKRKVPKEQISIFLGHLPKDSDATTSIYAPYEPEYCSEAVAAIESVMTEIRKHLKHANIDQPVVDAATLAKSIPSKTKKGVGDAKREEIRFLILSGLPHKEVVQRSKVSSGTVSLIRKEIVEAIPLYRNLVPSHFVPFSYLKDASSNEKDSQAIENIGGPGRTRTCDQTVMSGQL